MAEANRKKTRHLYFDQQRPLEEPKDAEHAPVVQEMFSRHEPTPEDEYFLIEQERRRRRQQREARASFQPVRTSEPAERSRSGTREKRHRLSDALKRWLNWR